MATVYAVASAKGGVGKTTTTAAVATLLADSGADVVAIDADLGMANLAAAVGVAPGGITLHDVLAGAADPLDAVHEGPAGLRVVPGAADLEAYAAADPSGLREVVAAFDDADYVLVDAGAGLSHDSTLPLGLADETLLVSTAEPSALGDTEKTRQLTERLGGTVAGAAITRLDPATAAGDDPIEAVDQTLDAPVIGRIPEDDAVLRAAESAQSLPLVAPDAPATRAYRDLTRALTGAPIEGPGLAAPEVAAEDEAAEDEPADAETAGDAATGDAAADDADAESDRDEAGPRDEEDIIVADSERAGLGDPGDEEDIIVADESPVEEAADAEGTEPTADAEDAEVAEHAEDDEGGVGVAPEDVASEPDATEAGSVASETETVGDDHVDGDDLEAMIGEDLEPEAFDDGTDEDDEDDATAASRAENEPKATARDAEIGADELAELSGPEGASRGAAPDSESESEPASDAGPPSEPEPNEEATPDPDDELAGSVPFRDDDTGTMNTVLSEDEEDDDENEDGGFFSRLLGR